MNILLGLIFLPILFGIIFYIAKVHNQWIVLLAQVTLILMAIASFLRIKGTGSLNMVVGQWPVGKGVGLKLDYLSAALLMLTTFLYFLFFLYDWGKLKDSLYVFLLFTLQGILCALLVSNDLFNIFVLMEISTVLITILMVFKKHSSSYYDALIYMLTSIVGMSFFLLAIGYIYRTYGVFDLELFNDAIQNTQLTKSTLLIYSLLFTGITFKIGFITIFAWFPRAHGNKSAPSVVSGILSGIYINLMFVYYIKFQNIFIPVLDTRQLFIWIGIFTSFFGGILALIQIDAKKLLAYSTVSQVGFIFLGLNLDKTLGYYGSVYHIMSHSMFKVLLFLITGIILNMYNTRKLSEIKGVMREMPVAGIGIILGALGVTGAPFFNGSIGKYLITQSTDNIGLEVLIYGLNFLTILYLSKFCMILFGKSTVQKSIAFSKKFVIIILGTLCLMGGVFAPVVIEFLFDYKVTIDLLSYILKAVIYLLSAAGGLYLYKYVLRRVTIIGGFRELDIPFNFIMMMVFALFFIIFGYVYIAYGTAVFLYNQL